MVLEFVTLDVPPGNREEVLRALRKLRGPWEADAGCVHCRILQDLGQEERLTFVSAWRTWGDLERHVKSDAYQSLLALMELSSTTPEVTFHTVNQTLGIELVEMLRGSESS